MDTDGRMYILLIILILMSSFFSASETAFLSVNKIRLKNYVENGDKKAERALKIANNYDKTLSTILIGNNVVNIASASVATILFTKIFGQHGGAIASTAIMTILVLIFGEIIPKSFAKLNSEKFSLAVATPLWVIIIILRPIVFIFVKITNLVKKISKTPNTPSVTEEELKYIIESIEHEGVLEEQESELVCSALEFDDTSVKEILTPRVDIIAVEANQNIDEVIEIIRENGYSRMPVYEKSIDKIIGIIRSRDVLMNKIDGKNIKVRNMIKKCLFIHKNMNISNLLAEFQAKNVHVAVVSDDYGGTMGLVTLEDVLEQLVGDIWDEYDEVTEEFIKINDNKFEVSGDLNINELFEYLDIKDKDFECDFSSVGGWVLESFERIPKIGESFNYKNLQVIVKEVDEQRIIKVIINKTKESSDE